VVGEAAATGLLVLIAGVVLAEEMPLLDVAAAVGGILLAGVAVAVGLGATVAAGRAAGKAVAPMADGEMSGLPLPAVAAAAAVGVGT
jgi:hypothetical protein